MVADDHLAEAGRKVLRFHLARMIAKEAGTRSGENAEDLHSMRVATRRQRAAWRIFGEAFRAKRTKAHRGRLREVASRLGAVRDLDVLIEAADQYRADLPITEQRSLEPLLAAWRTHRDDARLLLLRELDSDGYRRWLDDYAEFVRHEGVAALPVAPTDPHRVRDTAASRIQAAYEQVRAYEPVLRWADVETLHELRIAGKWLRYSLEFVRETLGPDADALIARVTALQDHLGLLHDADVSAHQARDFLVEHAGDLSDAESAAIGRYLVNREREVGRLRRTVGPVWRGVVGDRLPARSRAGARRPLTRAPPAGHRRRSRGRDRTRVRRSSRGPALRGDRASAVPARSAAMIAPSRIPVSTTRPEAMSSRSRRAWMIEAPAASSRIRASRSP